MRVYNTLTRRLEEFKTISDGEARVYICGMTTYDDMHIGHARTYLAFDVILRYLRYSGYSVRYIQNITDIDDKIIKRAQENGEDPLELSARFAKRARDDQKALGIEPADEYPTVSGHIQDIIGAIGTLIEKGHAYDVEGDVYFDVSSMPDYGKLSNQDPEQLRQHRVEPDPRKRNPADFSLWKRAAEGELSFPSPWGTGRPGWHIECSVMSQRYLGGRFDIHGGALDLIFPHHENEIAQSEALTGESPFVTYWLHTGFLQSVGEKMSKSLGNILSVREFLKLQSAQAYRIFILQAHYRSPIEYSAKKIEAAQAAWERLKGFRRDLDAAIENSSPQGDDAMGEAFASLADIFKKEMDDDFNTPHAMAALFDAVRAANPQLREAGQSEQSLMAAAQVFDKLMEVLGLKIEQGIELTEGQRVLIAERERHRAEKNWKGSDRIRDELLSQGIRIKDQGGTTIAERA